jgi:hypothetical protein
MLATILSLTFHALASLIDVEAGPNRKWVLVFDSVTSWPAWLCSVFVPSGHGIPQLVFPFLFSLAFYTAFFWLLLAIYERLRRKGVPPA